MAILFSELFLLFAAAIASAIFFAKPVPKKISRIFTLLTWITLPFAILSCILVTFGIYAPDPRMNGVLFVLFISIMAITLGMRRKERPWIGNAAIVSWALIFCFLTLSCLPFINVIVLNNPFGPIYTAQYKGEKYSCYAISFYGPPRFVITENHFFYSRTISHPSNIQPWWIIQNIDKADGHLEVSFREYSPGKTIDSTIVLPKDSSVY